MKLALAMIVKGTDGEAEVLARCLASVSKYVDGIFLTVTQPNDKVYETARLFNANISDYVWNNDFAGARNFNFSQVTPDYDYILWLDADDVLDGAENLKEMLEQNVADVYVMNYIYYIDRFNQPTIVHLKTQIVKNDGCVTWAGKLHEDFKPNRQIRSHFLKDVVRVHRSNDERFESAKARNLEVAQEQIKTEPNDPRSYWNLANAQKAKGNSLESIEAFNKFLEMSESEEEKYITRLRLADIRWDMGDKEKAIEEARYAVGLRPNYPDGYIVLGKMLMEVDRLKEAEEMILTSFTKKPPYYSVLVYNPRDYDYMPLMMLANIYFQQGRPDMALPCLEGCLTITPTNKSLKETIKTIKEKADQYEKIVKKVAKLKDLKDKTKLKQAIDRLPDDIRSHPLVCNLVNLNFIKEDSSGKDVVFFCGYTEKEWTPQIAKEKGVGGSEEAVIWLSKLLSEKGYNVTVYNNCGHKELNFDGVKYKPFWSWNYRDKQDVVILWRTPRMCDYDINSDKVIVDLHDVIQLGEFTPKRLAKIYKVFLKSNFHRSLFENIPDDKIVIVPNGIDGELFSDEVEKEHLIVNTSSPDRSLSALVELFPKIKEKVPDVKCKWAYGWDIWDVVHQGDAKKEEWKQNMITKMKDAGIEELGRISHGEVAELYKKGKVFAYPSEFAEIDCISLTKAMAAKCYPVTTNFAAMGDKSGHGGTFIKSNKNKDNWCQSYQYDFSIQDEKQKEEWVNAVVKTLTMPEQTLQELQTMQEYTQNYDWGKIVNKWIENF